MTQLDGADTVTIVVTISPYTDSLAATGIDSVLVLLVGAAVLLTAGLIARIRAQ